MTYLPFPLSIMWTHSYLSEISADLAGIKALGIDILYSYQMTQEPAWYFRPISATDAEMTAYLDAIYAAGLQTMISVQWLGERVVEGRPDKVLSVGELAALTAYVDKWKGHPAVWGWYADDETGAEYPIATRQQVYDAVKAAHPAGQVLEVHYQIVEGAYSPAVHDLFAIDSYPFRYTSEGGIVDRASGLVRNAAEAEGMLNAWGAMMAATMASLVAAGEGAYIPVMQACGHSTQGAFHALAMPPDSAIWRTWGRMLAGGWGAHGAGWFLWKNNQAASMPSEDLLGVGLPQFASRLPEIAAICAWPAAENFDHEAFGAWGIAPPPPRYDSAGLRTPTYSVSIGAPGTEPSEDITEMVDLDTLHRSMMERGEASATVDIPVSGENEVPCNYFCRDATLAIDVDGEREWLGQVVAVHKPQPQDLSYTLDCAGGWDTLHHCAPWCKGFVETRYDQFMEYAPVWYDLVSGGGFKVMTALDINSDGSLQWTLPKGSKVKVSQSRFGYIWPFSGTGDPDPAIARVTGTWVCGGVVNMRLEIQAADKDPFDGTAAIFNASSVLSDETYSGSFDVGSFGGVVPTHLRFWAYSFSDVAETAGEDFCQLTSLRIYFDRTTAPRVDEIVAAIDADVRPGAPAASTEAIGSPLAAFMLDPFMTPAEGIAAALTRAAAPPLCGIVQNQLVIKNRPTTPPDATRLWTVSEQITPGLEWGVEVDEEQSVDYVGVSYSSISGHPPDGTPCIAYYPAPPPNAAARTALIDGGDLTPAEAMSAAQQAYAYLHELASGPVVIPYVVQDANGNERPADVIRQWDWVRNIGSLDDATAGPFLVSEVEHQGHIATLTIGAAEAYAYNGPERMPTKGRYVGAHRVRSRTKQRVSFAKYWAWKHHGRKHKPGMPKKHAKYGTIHGYRWTDVEGRYT